MKKLLFVACLFSGMFVAHCQADFVTGARDTYWKQTANGGVGGWNDEGRWLGGVPSAELNAVISGYDDDFTVVIPNGASVNQLKLRTSSKDGGGRLTVNINPGAGGVVTMGAIVTDATTKSGGGHTYIQHSSGTLKVIGSSWSEGEGAVPIATGSLNSVLSNISTNAAQQWAVLPTQTWDVNDGIQLAWTHDNLYPLYFNNDGGDIADFDNFPMVPWNDYYSKSGLDYPVYSSDDWAQSGFYNPEYFDGTTWSSPFKNASTVTFDKTDLSAEIKAALGHTGYAIYDNGEEDYMYLLDLTGDYSSNLTGVTDYDNPFAYIRVARDDGGTDPPGPDPDPELPDKDGVRLPSTIRLGVEHDGTDPSSTVGSTFRLGGDALPGVTTNDLSPKVIDPSAPILEVENFEVLGNGRNKLETPGGVMRVANIAYEGTAGSTDNDLTYANTGAVIQFVYNRQDGTMMDADAKTAPALMKISGNYNQTGTGVLDMHAFRQAPDGTQNYPLIAEDGKTVLPAGTSDGSGYLLFDSDKLEVTAVAGYETLSGTFTAGGKLILDLTRLGADLYDTWHETTAGIAFDLFDFIGSMKNADNMDVEFVTSPTGIQVGNSADGDDGLYFAGTFDNAFVSEGVLKLLWTDTITPNNPDPVDGVPEPSTIMLMLMGLAGLFYARKRRGK